MFNTPTFLPQMSPFVPKLLLIIEPDLARGDMLIQTIRKETPYQAILATSMLDARHIFEHLKCDLCLLADSLLPMALSGSDVSQACVTQEENHDYTNSRSNGRNLD